MATQGRLRKIQDHLNTSPVLPAQTKTNGISGFQISDHTIENHRPLKVIVIGAGYSGIYLGIRIPERLRNVSLTIYEKNTGVGGTWFENRYPGVACDIASHSYQYKFEPNPNWSNFYAPGSEIREYLEMVAEKYGASRFIRLNHKALACDWDNSRKKWKVKIEEVVTGKIFEDESDIVISARGILNTVSWPEIPGLEKFEGELMHSATWNEEYNYSNKRIGVIGSGSSAIQIVPQLQKMPSTQLSCFIRGRTWVVPTISKGVWDQLDIPKDDGFAISEKVRKKLASDPDYWFKLRLSLEEELESIHGYYFKGHPVAEMVKEAFTDHMKERLAGREDIYDTILPTFAPGCRRLTPGPGFLEALMKDNVDFITSPITSIDTSGVNLQDGSHIGLDCLVCATGFQPSSAPPFPVTGKNGTTLKNQWDERPSSYLSLAGADMPNFFMMLGPNGGTAAGSLTLMLEATGDYICHSIRKMQREDLASMVPKQKAVETFMSFVDAYFAPTVFQDECRSWYRKGKYIIGLWPGSPLHLMEALRSPRWEDFDYEYIDDGKANGGWLGNGWSDLQNADGMGGRHLAWFIYPEFQDLPPTGRPEKALEEGGKYNIRSFA